MGTAPGVQVSMAIRHVHAQMVAYVNALSEEYQAAMRGAVERAIATFDFDAEVGRVVHEILRTRVREVVDEAVVRALSENEKGTEEIVRGAVEALRKKIGR